MRVVTYSHARQTLKSILDDVQQDGGDSQLEIPRRNFGRRAAFQMTVQNPRHRRAGDVGVIKVVIDAVAGLIAGIAPRKKLLNRSKGGP